ncbi:cob(I)yrinic acid a,c-diamide adenosyltransferase [Paremcibacter congregatus]|uniref:Corrinoid adenosyltransferase n=1 Tax=Paremcibacter congregatus TaxID=2043170 RepID=A0A2G4YS98_9PROT|nr:cob(I)yrinic acid a,c-diamide adenosyltransferase [Paremcibacter congregatus]PHZ84326.1 ATP:cob(I)alamin adenosyltransferase [Paremcibacter congregatus]QDE28545.1 cob(I)yrinic acid a,c-diamide adenosyltransferase [Paremcibacter congregatus]
MVKLTKIYTRGGDKGQTSLSDGSRQPKYAPRIEAYGTIDEANAAYGLARLHTTGEHDVMLSRIQNDLFDAGADVSTPAGSVDPQYELRIIEAQVTRLENEIDQMNADLAPLNSFILPGGSPAAAALHLCRTIVRRAERLLVQTAETEDINPVVIRYLNRLSDHAFVMGRALNNNGADDVLWVPGANR